MKACTFEPLEIYPESAWGIYDPNTARLVATFHDYEQAMKYLRWINRKQAKKQARKQARRGDRQVFL